MMYEDVPQTNTLLSCPFCGKSAILVEVTGRGKFEVMCKNVYCQCSINPEDTELDAIKKWNTRTTLSRRQAMDYVFNAIIDDKRQPEIALTNFVWDLARYCNVKSKITADEVMDCILGSAKQWFILKRDDPDFLESFLKYEGLSELS